MRADGNNCFVRSDIDSFRQKDKQKLARLSIEGNMNKPSRIELTEAADPHPAECEVLFKIRSIGRGSVDLSRRSGHQRAIITKPAVPVVGLEAAVYVTAIGPGASGIRSAND